MKTSYKVALFVLLEAITIGVLYNFELPQPYIYEHITCDVEPLQQEYDCSFGKCLGKYMILKYNTIETVYKLNDNFRLNTLSSQMDCSYRINNPNYLHPGHLQRFDEVDKIQIKSMIFLLITLFFFIFIFNFLLFYN